MWLSAALVILTALVLLNPRLRGRQGPLTFACLAVVLSIWIEKGLGMIVTGFVPSPLGHVTSYSPTLPEALITLGIYGIGALLITVFYKVTLSLRGEVEA
jgi:molybdopterin-containing oxidoreductase family membrane subunit